MKKENDMPIDRNDKLLKYPNKYVHKAEYIYNKNTVKNFMKAWKEDVENKEQLLERKDEIVEQSIESAVSDFEESLQEIKEGIEEDMSLEKEELKKKLYDQRMAEIKEQQNMISEADEKKEELKEKVKEELEPYFEKHEQSLKEKKDAIEFWSNPDTK